MAKSFAGLKADALVIKNEVEESKNTATRIGTMFSDVVEKMENVERETIEQANAQFVGNIVNNLTDGGADKALSAEMGKRLNSDLNGGISEIPIASSLDNAYITFDGGLIKSTTSERAVAKFPIEEGKIYNLFIPKTGNQYAAFYGFSNKADIAVEPSEYVANYVGVGNQAEYTADIDTIDIEYPYIAVCYSIAGGVPTLTTKGESLVDRVDKLESSVNEVGNSAETNKAKIKNLESVLVPSLISIPIASSLDNAYITFNGGLIRSTTSERAVAKFPIEEGKIYNLFIPKTGNQYAAFYGFSNKADIAVEPSEYVANYVGVGNQAEYTADIDTIDIEYPYIAVCYSIAGGVPTLTTKGESLVDRVDKLESSVNEVESLVSAKTTIFEGVEIILPSEIFAVVGDNLQIFWRSIISAFNPYVFDVYAVSPVGKSYPRYFEFNPTSDMIGKSYSLTVYVKSNNGTIVAKRTTNLRVITAMHDPTVTKNILCVGASATANGLWAGELSRRLTSSTGDDTANNPTGLGLSHIAFVGRKVGTQHPINLEATGGWKVQDYANEGRLAIRFYVTGIETLVLGARYICNGTIYVIQEVNVTEGSGNIRCTLEGTFVVPTGNLIKISGNGDAEIAFTSYEEEKFSPFWNEAESRIDFSGYADAYCDAHIDCIIWHCGVNDIVGGNPVIIPTVIEAFRELLTAFHEQFPQGKVIISSVPVGSCNGGFGANYGANSSLNYYTFARIAQLYAQALNDLCAEYASFVTYAPVLEEFDVDNGYPIKQKAVNNRSAITEAIGTNGVHPTTEGSFMVADAIYRTFNTLEL